MQNLSDFLKDRITISLRDYLNGISNDLLKVLIILVYLKRKNHSHMNYNLEEVQF